MDETRGKRAIVLLSSSSSEEVDDHDIEDSLSDDDDDEDDDDEISDDRDDESLSNKVVALLQGFKDGHGYTFYPRSSFIIDCTGDVCKGDVVLFRQKVYEKFDKVTQQGRHVGKRTVAGRVVKESYGALKQQHTFTVEVIWSNGVKKLPPLFSLLVKGRNLYKLKTYRQKWKNEAERVKVLSEKHRRGAKARLVRAMRQKKKKGNANGCFNDHCEIQHTGPPKLRRSCKVEKVRHLDGHGRAISDCKPQETTSSRQETWKHNASSRVFRSTRGWDKSSDCYQLPVHSLYANSPQSFYQPQVNYHRRIEACCERGLTLNRIEFPPLRPYVDENVPSRSRKLTSSATSHAYTNPRNRSEIKHLNAEHVDWPPAFISFKS